MSSMPGPDYGAPSLGPIDRITQPPRPEYGLAWDDNRPATWRTFEEPNDTNEKDPR